MWSSKESLGSPSCRQRLRVTRCTDLARRTLRRGRSHGSARNQSRPLASFRLRSDGLPNSSRTTGKVGDYRFVRRISTDKRACVYRHSFTWPKSRLSVHLSHAVSRTLKASSTKNPRYAQPAEVAQNPSSCSPGTYSPSGQCFRDTFRSERSRRLVGRHWRFPAFSCPVDRSGSKVQLSLPTHRRIDITANPALVAGGSRI